VEENPDIQRKAGNNEPKQKQQIFRRQCQQEPPEISSVTVPGELQQQRGDMTLHVLPDHAAQTTQLSAMKMVDDGRRFVHARPAVSQQAIPELRILTTTAEDSRSQASIEPVPAIESRATNSPPARR
jgi:hypothetical protein